MSKKEEREQALRFALLWTQKALRQLAGVEPGDYRVSIRKAKKYLQDATE